MKSIFALACILGAFAAMPASASTMKIEFPGGEISDEVDEDNMPTGHKLYMTKELKLKKSSDLKKGEIMTFKTNFGGKTVSIFDDKPNSDESIHIEINGKVIKSVDYFVKYLNEKGRWKLVGTGSVDGNDEGPQASERKDAELVSHSGLFGEEQDASKNLLGLSISFSTKT